LAKTPDTGRTPPDFTLPGVVLKDGDAVEAEYTLSAHRGRPVVLAFYPGDNTSVCTRQLCSYTSGLESFTNFGADVWAISPQGLASHEQFARKHSLAFPLLADDGLKVSRLYGITLGGAGLRRSVFVIDAEGILRWKHVTLVGFKFPPVETISAQLATLTAA
jgi:thioredoxin-dependent peroxiredoxin